MTSKFLYTYCSGDVSRVENFELSQKDFHNTWVAFHRNLITGVGLLKSSCLKSIGKFTGVRPEELIMMKREDVLELKRKTKPIRKGGYACYTVFKFWSQLHPDKLFSEITEREFDEIQRSVHRLRIIIRQMKSRCNSPTSQDWKWYGAKGIKVCEEWSENTDTFVLWALKNGYVYYPEKRKGDQLSIDRIDAYKGYCPENCRWITHRLNCQLTHKGIKHVRRKRGA